MCVPVAGLEDIPRKLNMISPEGLAHAILAGAAGNLPANQEMWKNILLSVPCCFEAVPAAEMYMRGWNSRQQLLQEHESLARTAFQMALELAELKAT